MKELKDFLQAHIGAEITIGYGCIGYEYTHILIVQDGKIVSIGSLLYRFWREDFMSYEPYKNQAEKLAIEAEKFRTGKIKKQPTLCFTGIGTESFKTH